MKRALGLIILTAACVTVPRLTPTQVAWASEQWPDAPQGELEHGRSLYVSRCSGCHVAPEPAEVMQKKDDPMMQEMAGRAHLTEAEQLAVLHFLEAATRGTGTGLAER